MLPPDLFDLDRDGDGIRFERWNSYFAVLRFAFLTRSIKHLGFGVKNMLIAGDITSSITLVWQIRCLIYSYTMSTGLNSKEFLDEGPNSSCRAMIIDAMILYSSIPPSHSDLNHRNKQSA